MKTISYKLTGFIIGCLIPVVTFFIVSFLEDLTEAHQIDSCVVEIFFQIFLFLYAICFPVVFGIVSFIVSILFWGIIGFFIGTWINKKKTRNSN